MANGITLGAMFKLQDNYTKVLDKITKGTDKAASSINMASKAADKMGSIMSTSGAKASSGIDKLTQSTRRLVSAAAVIGTIIKGAAISDGYMNTKSRIDLMNDGLQTTKELQNDVMKSAFRARGAYTDMAASAAKLGMLAPDAFKSSKEVVVFTELIQKSFKVGGASSVEQSTGMYQLAQAMASGRLQGDEFRSISENAPMITQAIAQYTGKSIGELKVLSSEGAITAGIIKDAMFAAADDIEAKFKKMPILWSDIWGMIKNGGIMAFDTIIEKINALINTEVFMGFVNTIIVGFQLAATGIGFVIDRFIWLGDVISSMWGIIGPILTGIVVVTIPAIIGGVTALVGKLWLLTYPMRANVALWMMANLPMILLIASIVGVITMLEKMGITFDEICGVIGGTIMSLVAFIYNYFVVYLWNSFSEFSNFFGNVFTNPVASVKKLFYDLMVSSLGFIEMIAKGIENLLNAISGVEVNITSGITGFKDNLAAKAASIADENGLREFVKTKEFWDLGDAAGKGYALGAKVGTGIDGAIFSIGSFFGGLGMGDLGPMGDLFADGVPVMNKQGGALDVSMDKEDIKYLKDLAEKEYVAKFNNNTLAPQIHVQFGDVHENADAEQVAGIITRVLKEEIATVKEG